MVGPILLALTLAAQPVEPLPADTPRMTNCLLLARSTFPNDSDHVLRALCTQTLVGNDATNMVETLRRTCAGPCPPPTVIKEECRSRPVWPWIVATAAALAAGVGIGVAVAR